MRACASVAFRASAIGKPKSSISGIGIPRIGFAHPEIIAVIVIPGHDRLDHLVQGVELYADGHLDAPRVTVGFTLSRVILRRTMSSVLVMPESPSGVRLRYWHRLVSCNAAEKIAIRLVEFKRKIHKTVVTEAHRRAGSGS